MLHERSFYVKNVHLNSDETVKPGKVFAMSIGDTLIDASIGRFAVTQLFSDRLDPDTNSSTEL